MDVVEGVKGKGMRRLLLKSVRWMKKVFARKSGWQAGGQKDPSGRHLKERRRKLEDQRGQNRKLGF